MPPTRDASGVEAGAGEDVSPIVAFTSDEGNFILPSRPLYNDMMKDISKHLLIPSEHLTLALEIAGRKIITYDITPQSWPGVSRHPRVGALNDSDQRIIVKIDESSTSTPRRRSSVNRATPSSRHNGGRSRRRVNSTSKDDEEDDLMGEDEDTVDEEVDESASDIFTAEDSPPASRRTLGKRKDLRIATMERSLKVPRVSNRISRQPHPDYAAQNRSGSLDPTSEEDKEDTPATPTAGSRQRGKPHRDSSDSPSHPPSSNHKRSTKPSSKSKNTSKIFATIGQMTLEIDTDLSNTTVDELKMEIKRILHLQKSRFASRHLDDMEILFQGEELVDEVLEWCHIEALDTIEVEFKEPATIPSKPPTERSGAVPKDGTSSHFK